MYFAYFFEIYGRMIVMNYQEFKRQMGKAGLLNREFATLIGVHEKTISNMAKKNKVPNHMAALVVLMGLLADKHISFENELRQLNLKKAGSRGRSFPKNENNDVKNPTE